MTTTEEIKNALADEGMMSLFEKYAAQLNMTVDECIVSLAGDWEGEEDGLLRSVREGDLKAMLVEACPRPAWMLADSQSERTAYEEMAFSAGRESARVLSDEDLAIVDASQVAAEVFAADEEAGLLDVDDVEEARAIFIPAFAAGYEDLKKSRKEGVEEVA